MTSVPPGRKMPPLENQFLFPSPVALLTHPLAASVHCHLLDQEKLTSFLPPHYTIDREEKKKILKSASSTAEDGRITPCLASLPLTLPSPLTQPTIAVPMKQALSLPEQRRQKPRGWDRDVGTCRVCRDTNANNMGDMGERDVRISRRQGGTIPPWRKGKPQHRVWTVLCRPLKRTPPTGLSFQTSLPVCSVSVPHDTANVVDRLDRTSP